MGLRRYTLQNTLASLDIFSQPVPSFNINGHTKISSFAGSILSCIVLLILLFYGTNKFKQLLERSNPTISSFVERGALTKEDHLNLRDSGLRFAFGIEGWRDKELKDDPRYVKTIVRQVGQPDGGPRYEKLLPYHHCEVEDY